MMITGGKLGQSLESLRGEQEHAFGSVASQDAGVLRVFTCSNAHVVFPYMIRGKGTSVSISTEFRCLSSCLVG